MTCPNTKPSQSTCLAKSGYVLPDKRRKVVNDFLRDFVMLHNAMQAKTEQDTRRTKLEEIDRTWAAIQAIDTSGTVPR